MDDKEATPVKDTEQILPPMEPAEPVPVSYTHLDVYKRQMLNGQVKTEKSLFSFS